MTRLASNRPLLAPARSSSRLLLHHPATKALAASLLLCATACSPENAAASTGPELFTVRRGDMRIVVTANAEIQAAKETRIRSEVEGQNTVIYLIPEGREVKAGEKLVELDSAELIERKARQEIDVARAEAVLVQAVKALEIQKKQVEADDKAAEVKVIFAELDLEKFQGKVRPDGSRDMGEEKQQIVAAQSDIELAESEYNLAAEKHEWSVKLHAKGFITKNELERDKLDMDRRKAAIQLAKNKYDLLVQFTHLKMRTELAQNLDDAKLEQARVKARGEAQLAQAVAEQSSRKQEYDLAKERLQNLAKQINNAVITAPTDGLVVYAAQGDGGRRNEFITEGATVRERQTLIILPDTTRMIATLKVPEAQVDKVKLGQFAEVVIDAMPDMPAFTGRVRKISPLPDSGSRWSNPDLKVFPTEVEIDGANTVLKPGMSAKVNIVITDIEDTLRVPLQAIQRQGVVQYVWRKTPSGAEAVRVELGQFDTTFVQVLKGIEDGDVVYQVPPTNVQAPKYEQPPQPANTPIPSLNDGPDGPGGQGPANGGPMPANGVSGRGNRGAPISGDGPPQDGAAPRPRGAGGPGAMGGAMAEIQKLLDERQPELAARLKAEGMALMRDAEFMAAIQADPEIKAKFDEMRTRMGAGRRPRGEGTEGGQPGGGRPRGEGGGQGRPQVPGARPTGEGGDGR